MNALSIVKNQANRTLVSADRILERIFKMRKITRLDQQLLMSAMLSKDSINDRDRLRINQVFDSVRQGRLKVVD